MRHISQALLVIFLIVVTTDYSMQLSCFECDPCPHSFSTSSPYVTTRSNCTWCAKLSVPIGHNIVRECAPECSFDYFSRKYPEISYYCCQKEYCNKSVNTRGMHRIQLIIIITFICFFISKKI